jgi:hypothetical protein
MDRLLMFHRSSTDTVIHADQRHLRRYLMVWGQISRVRDRDRSVDDGSPFWLQSICCMQSMTMAPSPVISFLAMAVVGRGQGYRVVSRGGPRLLTD